MLRLRSEWFAHLHMTLKLLTLPYTAQFPVFPYSPLAILLTQMLVVKITWQNIERQALWAGLYKPQGSGKE